MEYPYKYPSTKGDVFLSKGSSLPRAVMCLLAIMPSVVLALAVLFDSNVTYNRWDNFDNILPIVYEAHSRLLSGDIPHMNAYQFMGEPVVATIQAGVFYPVYTLCVGVINILNVSPLHLLNLIAVVHTGILSLGMYWLIRKFKVKPFIALTGAYSFVFSGFYLYWGSKWLFLLCIASWTPFAVGACHSIMTSRTFSPSMYALATWAMLMQIMVGYPQFAFYMLLSYALFCLVYGLLHRICWRRWIRLGVVAVTVLLFAMPSLLPTYELMKLSERATPMGYARFAQRPMNPRGIVGMLLPVFKGWDYFSELSWLATPYMGGWIVPVLLSVAVAIILNVCIKKRKDTNKLPVNFGVFVCAGFTALMFLVLSLGDEGGLLKLTYGLPVWSNFRWPFKFFGVVVPYLVLTAALGLQFILDCKWRAITKWVSWCCAAVALLIWMLRMDTTQGFMWLTGVSGLILLVVLPLTLRRRMGWILPLVVLVTHSALLLSLHYPDRLMTFVPMYTGYGAEELGMDPEYRIFPISDRRDDEIHMHEMCLYLSATMNQYYSLTGHIFGMTPSVFRSLVPGLASGAMIWDIPYRKKFLQSHLLRALNTRYVRVAKGDAAAMSLMKSMPCYQPIKETERAVTYSNSNALKRVYFAPEILPFNEEAFRQGMVDNHATLFTAFVDGVEEPREMPVGKVVKYEDTHERMMIEVANDKEGFLVVSRSYYPEWRAYVDGIPVPLYRVNALVCGLFIPGGARHVDITYCPIHFYKGLTFASVGLLLFTGMLAGLSLRGRRSEA